MCNGFDDSLTSPLKQTRTISLHVRLYFVAIFSGKSTYKTLRTSLEIIFTRTSFLKDKWFSARFLTYFPWYRPSSVSSWCNNCTSILALCVGHFSSTNSSHINRLCILSSYMLTKRSLRRNRVHMYEKHFARGFASLLRNVRQKLCEFD